MENQQMLKELLQNKRLLEIIKFGINGGICFVIEYSILKLLIYIFGQQYYLLFTAIAFCISVIANYFICKFWVFDSAKKQDIRSLTLFIGSSVVGMFLNMLFMRSEERRVGKEC